MDKLAVFVEGQTEEVFVTELIRQIAGHARVHIDSVHAYGGAAAGDRRFLEVNASRPAPDTKFYVIIYNSEGYSRILSDIREHHANLCAQGFKVIIGLRDVRPQVYDDIRAIRDGFLAFAPRRPVQPLLVLAIMEVETWFIAEMAHFPQISARLNRARVVGELGYDPDLTDMEQQPDPAGDLQRVYRSVGRGYNKSRRHAERTANVLDYEVIYLHFGQRFRDLGNLITYLNGFFSAPSGGSNP